MGSDASPFFIRPHRFDCADQDDAAFPWLDWRRRIILDEDERVLWRGQLDLAGYLLGPADTELSWRLPCPADVTVTTHRLAYVCAGWEMERSAQPSTHRPTGSPRHLRPGAGGRRVATGQVRWQWPSRLRLLPAAAPHGPHPGRPAQILVICDALRAVRQPTLSLSGAALGPTNAARDLAHLIRRTVAKFRLGNPITVELSPPERDALQARARTTQFAEELSDPERGVDLPGALVVEFVHRDDYYRRPARDAGRHATGQ